MSDIFQTIEAPVAGLFKDRGSKFLAFAYPVASEAAALAHLERLRKEHFKANHHCFAWRLGLGQDRFRTNDDGEPSGTAGRPILGQIDALALTDVVVVVVRYFGGTLLGTSGLINAYRESTAEALRQAKILQKIVKDQFLLDFDYAIMPDLMHALKKLDIETGQQTYGDRGQLQIGIRQSEVSEKLLLLKAALWKVSVEEAAGGGWPAGMNVEAIMQ